MEGRQTFQRRAASASAPARPRPRWRYFVGERMPIRWYLWALFYIPLVGTPVVLMFLSDLDESRPWAARPLVAQGRITDAGLPNPGGVRTGTGAWSEVEYEFADHSGRKHRGRGNYHFRSAGAPPPIAGDPVLVTYDGDDPERSRVGPIHHSTVGSGLVLLRFAVIALLLAWFSIRGWRKAGRIKALIDGGAVAEAHLVAAISRRFAGDRARSSVVSHAAYAFEDAGGRIHQFRGTVPNVVRGRFAFGKQVIVAYDPTDPRRHVFVLHGERALEAAGARDGGRPS